MNFIFFFRKSQVKAGHDLHSTEANGTTREKSIAQPAQPSSWKNKAVDDDVVNIYVVHYN